MKHHIKILFALLCGMQINIVSRNITIPNKYILKELTNYIQLNKNETLDLLLINNDQKKSFNVVNVDDSTYTKTESGIKLTIAGVTKIYKNYETIIKEALKNGYIIDITTDPSLKISLYEPLQNKNVTDSTRTFTFGTNKTLFKLFPTQILPNVEAKMVELNPGDPKKGFYSITVKGSKPTNINFSLADRGALLFITNQTLDL